GGEICYAVEGENTYHAIFGGSGCYIVHPSDTASPLVALRATVKVVGPKGARSLPVEKLFVLPEVDHTRETVLAPGEVLTEVLLPPPLEGAKGLYRKGRSRGAWDFALGGVALGRRRPLGRRSDAVARPRGREAPRREGPRREARRRGGRARREGGRADVGQRLQGPARPGRRGGGPPRPRLIPVDCRW
ncbi:MAG TPA: FAD binding domain-containing protein, partial [Thermoanaerobaculia bacterium]|nr:FAD binding domain-containing protein [Thermoanaerobaculia bacterium]